MARTLIRKRNQGAQAGERPAERRLEPSSAVARPSSDLSGPRPSSDVAEVGPASAAEGVGYPPAKAGQTPALLTLLVCGWVAISPTALRYPIDAQARDTAIWSSYLGVLLGVLAVARLRAPLLTSKAAVALPLGGLLLAALPFLTISLRPQGEMQVAWWNMLISGVLVVALSVAGLVRLRASRRNMR